MDSNPQHFVANLEHLSGRVLAFRETPKGIPLTDPLVRICLSAAIALLALDRKSGEIDRQRLTFQQQRDAVAGEFAAVQIKLAAARAAVTTAGMKHAADMRELFTPKAIDDVANVLRDIERRAAFYAADQTERAELWSAMGSGEHVGLLAALARFEFGATANRARILYEELARAANPARVAEFQLEDERLGWASQVVALITAALDESAQFTGPANLVIEEQTV